MTYDMAVASFGLAVGLILLAVGVLYAYRQTMLDVFRSNLFALRDEMCMHMLKSNVPLDTQQYRLLRDLINGLIRFAPQFHLAVLFLAIFATREAGIKDSDILKSLAELPEGPLKEYLMSVYHRLASLAMRYLMIGGTQTFLVMPVIILYSLVRRHGAILEELPPVAADRVMYLGREESTEGKRLRRAMAV